MSATWFVDVLRPDSYSDRLVLSLSDGEKAASGEMEAWRGIGADGSTTSAKVYDLRSRGRMSLREVTYEDTL